jgi:hypothetical protein
MIGELDDGQVGIEKYESRPGHEIVPRLELESECGCYDTSDFDRLAEQEELDPRRGAIVRIPLPARP